MLGTPSPLLWWLVSLCLVLLALGGAAWRRSVPILIMTCAIAVAAILPAVILQSIIFFAVSFLVLQGLSALAALSVLLNWPFLSPRR